jgi:hypothetical protein
MQFDIIPRRCSLSKLFHRVKNSGNPLNFDQIVCTQNAKYSAENLTDLPNYVKFSSKTISEPIFSILDFLCKHNRFLGRPEDGFLPQIKTATNCRPVPLISCNHKN